MAEKPDKFPDWATEDQIDPVSGQNNVVEPPDIRKRTGWTRREIPPRQWWNWMARKTAEWLRWFEPRADKVDAATREPTPNTLMMRDANGRSQIATPEEASEIANKGYVDAVADDFADHVEDTSPHSATAAATANRIVLRDGSGRAQVAAPSAAADIARKAETDAVQTNLNSHRTSGDHDDRYARRGQNLSDLNDAATARNNLGLGSAATQADTRYAHRGNNLNDLANPATARTNLGLGPAATMGTTASRTDSSTSTLLQAAGMNNHRTSGDHDGRYAQRGNNLSDLSSATTARSNLGLGTAAQQEDGRYAHRNNNLSDLESASSARSNLGLGSAATATLQSSQTDNSPGRILTVGAFGIGGILPELPGDTLDYPAGTIPPGLYRVTTSTAGRPAMGEGSVLVTRRASAGGEVQLLMGDGTGPQPIYTRCRSTAGWTPWSEIYQSTFFTGNNHSLSSNGYQPLPGGLILQWGNVNMGTSVVTVNLPVAFPTAGLHSSASRSADTRQDIERLTYSTGVTRTQISIAPAIQNTNNNSVMWFALGY